jgi:hypothetical protein
MAAQREALSETVLEALQHEDGSHQPTRPRDPLVYLTHERRHKSQASQPLQIMRLIMQPQWSATSSMWYFQH